MKRKTKRILFKGQPAKQGTCVCGGTIIITDPVPGKGFISSHSVPQCEEYKARCAHLKPIYEALDDKDIQEVK